MAFKLIEDEQCQLSTIVRSENALGYGEGMMEAGCVLNQAVLLGACNYLMHYDVHAVGDVQVAYLSRKAFIEGTESINSMAIDGYVDFLLRLPGFGHLSKGVAKKIVNTSKMVNIPKDWRYLASPANNSVFLILAGSVDYEFSNATISDDNKQINLRSFLSGEKNFQRTDRVAINDHATLRKQSYNLRLQQ